MFLQSGFDVYRYYSKCQAVHNKMHAYFYGKKHAPSTNDMGSVYLCLSVLLHSNSTGTPHLYTPWYLLDYFLSTIRSCSNTCSVCRPYQFIPLCFQVNSRNWVFINFDFLTPTLTLIYGKKARHLVLPSVLLKFLHAYLELAVNLKSSCLLLGMTK